MWNSLESRRFKQTLYSIIFSLLLLQSINCNKLYQRQHKKKTEHISDSYTGKFNISPPPPQRKDNIKYLVLAPEMSHVEAPKARLGVDYTHHHRAHGSRLTWTAYKPSILVEPMNRKPLGSGISVGHLKLGQPVYVGMTTTKSRLLDGTASNAVRDVLNGTIIPTHVFLFISETGNWKDEGILRDSLPRDLIKLASTQPFTIVFTNNIGPHRKLLPILAKFWSTDCVIITLDDDRPSYFTQTAVEKLLTQYVTSGKTAIVALRARRIGLCSGSWTVTAYDACSWPVVQNGAKEMLSLPTGSGGVLYRPRFFDEVIFELELNDITRYNDDIMFRLASLIKGTPVVMGCCDEEIDCPDAKEFDVSSVHPTIQSSQLIPFTLC